MCLGFQYINMQKKILFHTKPPVICLTICIWQDTFFLVVWRNWEWFSGLRLLQCPFEEKLPHRSRHEAHNCDYLHKKNKCFNLEIRKWWCAQVWQPSQKNTIMCESYQACTHHHFQISNKNTYIFCGGWIRVVDFMRVPMRHHSSKGHCNRDNPETSFVKHIVIIFNERFVEKKFSWMSLYWKPKCASKEPRFTRDEKSVINQWKTETYYRQKFVEATLNLL